MIIVSLSANYFVPQASCFCIQISYWITPPLHNFTTILVHIFTRIKVDICCIHFYVIFYYCSFVFRRYDVNGFGIWGCSTFKIFVKKRTDHMILVRDLIKLNQSFFKNYQILIVNEEGSTQMSQCSKLSLYH